MHRYGEPGAGVDVAKLHKLETADIERLTDLTEAFLTSDDQVMRDAFIMPGRVSRRPDA